MKRLVFVVLLVFLATNAYGASSGWTPVTLDSSWVTDWQDIEGGIIYRISLPCSLAGGGTGAVIDSFRTWAIDISRYRSIAVGYYCDTVSSTAGPALCSLEVGYEQSFQKDDSTFATPSGHSLLETSYSDTSGVFTWKEIYPAAATFIRFYFKALAGHDISPNGRIYFYIYLSKSPVSYMRQGGVGWFSDIRIRSPSHGIKGPKWFHMFVTENGDTIHFKWEGGGPNRRTIWNNSVYFTDTCKPSSMLHIAGEMSFGEGKGGNLTGSPPCTLTLAQNDNTVQWGINCNNGTKTLSYIDDTHGADVNEGMFVILGCANANDTLVIDHKDGAGKNLVLGHDDTLFGTADRAFFIENDNDQFVGFVTKRVAGRPGARAFFYAADAQADDDYEVSIPGVLNLWAGLTVTFKANTLNTGAATLEITSVGDLDVIAKLSDQVLATGDILAGQIVTVVFDGGKWQMTSQLAQ